MTKITLFKAYLVRLIIIYTIHVGLFMGGDLGGTGGDGPPKFEVGTALAPVHPIF